MNRSFDSLERAAKNAVRRHLFHGVFFGSSELKTSPDTAAVRQTLSQSEVEWQLLDGTFASRYTAERFVYAQDESLFAKSFASAFGGVDRAPPILQRMTSALSQGSVSTIAYPFVLSKTAANMSWHVDGGTSGGTDLVVYYVLGPPDAVSVIRLFGIDRPVLYAKQAVDATMPSEALLRKKLALLDNKVDVLPPTMTSDDQIHRLPNLPAEIAAEIQRSDATLNAHLDCLGCWQISAKEGDVVVFDGSQLHSVHNVPGTSGLPQLALAVNFRQIVDRMEREALSRRPIIRFTDPTVRCDECGDILDDNTGLSVQDSQKCNVRRCDTWACIPCAQKTLPKNWTCRRHSAFSG